MNYNYIQDRNSLNYTPNAQSASVFGRARSVQGITWHWWGDPGANPTAEGVVNWLCNPAAGTSAHFVVTGTGRRVWHIVNNDDVAWHSGNAIGNATTIGVEVDPRCRPEDYDVAAEVGADLIAYYGDILNYRHSDWTNTRCCGNLNVVELDKIIYQKLADRNKQPEPAPNPIPKPTPTPEPEKPEWVKNLVKVSEVKKSVNNVNGATVYNLETLQAVKYSSGETYIIPDKTQVDISSYTTVNGVKYLISSYAASHNKATGIKESDLTDITTEYDKPEWLKNIHDITDVDMWTRSDTQVMSLKTGEVVKTIPKGTKIRISHSISWVDKDWLVLDGTLTEDDAQIVESLYLSDKETEEAPKKSLWDNLVELIQKIINTLKETF